MNSENSVSEIQEVDLSRREKEVILHIAEDEPSQQIADKLFVSKRTVDFHINNILAKLRLGGHPVVSRVGIIRYAIKTGLVKY